MTVATMAQRHRRIRATGVLGVVLFLVVVLGGITLAAGVQREISVDVLARLGVTEVPIEITVMGTEVLLRTPVPLTLDRVDTVRAVRHVSVVVVEVTP